MMNRHFLSRLVLILSVLASGFIVKSEASAIGSFAWVQQISGTNGESISDIAVDSVGSVYTTGNFSGSADLDPGPGTANLTTAGGSDIFIAKLDSNSTFLWARSLGGVDFDGGSSIVVDASGNVYTSGYFVDTVDFDPGPGTAILTSAGIRDIFILKLDPNGNFLWARSMGGADQEGAHGLSVDPGGNVYITGTFPSTADFDPGPGSAILTSAGGYDIFISKLDPNGNFLWAKRMGGADLDESHSLAVDTSGNVYTTGLFAGTTDFDPGPGITNVTSAGGYDIFLSKLDTNGNFVWAKRIGGAGEENGLGLAINASNDLYTTGLFGGTVDFDPGIGTTDLTSAGYRDVFIAKLDSNGSLLWAKNMGGAGFDTGLDLALDPSSSVYITGVFEGTADFDPGMLAANLTEAGTGDVFITKLDRDGSFVWAKRLGGAGEDQSEGIAVDTSGSVYATGYFEGTADFDPGPGTTSLTSAGWFDGFVSKLGEVAVFGDLPPGYWAGNFIERLYAAGITGGCSTSPPMYCPEDTVTRAQMAVFLLRGIHTASYTPPAVGAATGFGDVPVDYWAAPFVKQLAVEAITSGCGGGNYCPEAPVTRAQMAVFLLRSKHGASYTPPAVGTSTGFGDVPSDYWAAAFIKQLISEGITAGCGGGNYCPEAPVTRAQMAVFLVRTFSLP